MGDFKTVQKETNNLTYRQTYLSNNNLQIRVAELYIFLLPWNMIVQFSFLKTIFGPCANDFNFVLHMIGLFLMYMSRQGKFRIEYDKRSSLFHYFVIMIIIMNLSSFVMSIALHDKLGTIGGEDTYRAIAGQIVYYFQYIFIVLYNREVFRLVPKERIEKIFNKILMVLMILGYFQILVILFGGFFSKIYHSLDVFKVLWSASSIAENQRLSLTGSEPASAGSFICNFVIPFLMAKILYYGNSYKTTLQFILWLPILYFTKSSTGYVLLILCFVIFIYLYLFKGKHRIKNFKILIFITLAAIIIIPNYKTVMNSDFVQNIQYLTIDKTTNRENQATMSRKVPLIVNYKTFLEYPILGVGNGNQGFFYLKHFPSWAYSSYDVDHLIISAKETPANGSLFVPSILSGYGLLGAILVVIYIIKCKRLVSINREDLGMFYYMFIISSIVIFFIGFSSEFVGNYEVWFLLSLPYLSTKVN